MAGGIALISDAPPPDSALDVALWKGVGLCCTLNLDIDLERTIRRLNRAGIELRNIHDEAAGDRTQVPQGRVLRFYGRVATMLGRRNPQRITWPSRPIESYRAVVPDPDSRLRAFERPKVARGEEPLQRRDGSLARRDRTLAGVPYQRDYLDRSGNVYLTRSINKSGNAYGAVRFSEHEVKIYFRIDQWHTDWLDQIISQCHHVIGVGAAASRALAEASADLTESPAEILGSWSQFRDSTRT